MSELKQIPVGSKVKTATGYQREYTLAEVAQHNKDDDCWMVIHGKVYDCNGFLVDHPGGPEILLNEGGTDATVKFEEVFHSEDARNQLKDLCVGTLKGYQGPKDGEVKKKKAGQTSNAQSGANPAIYLVALAAVAGLVYAFVL